MFGIGFFECVAIVLAALILIRPKDLPRLLRKAGKLYRQATDQLKAAKRMISDAGEELTQPEESEERENVNRREGE